MKKIALLSCTSKKKDYKCTAREMYSESPIFKNAYGYAKKYADKIFILSAKYGLLEEDTFVEPYNFTLNNQDITYRKQWSNDVLKELRQHTNLENDKFIIVTGKRYYEFLIESLRYYEIPLKGKSLGFWISTLKGLIDPYTYSKEIDAIAVHALFQNMPRHNYKSINEVPFKNGIYIMFSRGERFNGDERIVRVGTHTGQDNLKDRLYSHFRGKNQRSSIFRRNIGRVYLNRDNKDYIPIWNSNRDNEYIDVIYEKVLEEKISEYMCKHITFTCFRVEDKYMRKRLEDAIISTLNSDPEFCASKEWLGNNSPIEGISNSGLWCVHGLNAKPLNGDEYEIIKQFTLGKDIAIANKKDNQVVGKETSKPSYNSKTTRTSSKVNNVKEYISNKIIIAQTNGKQYIDIVSGEIHKELGLVNSMPTVCSAMYKLVKHGDKILNTTPSGKSSTIKIRYYT